MSNRFIPDRGTAPLGDKAPVFADKPPEIYTPSQVAVTTFLGGPLAGAIVLAVMHGRARTGRAGLMILLGVIVSVLLGLAEYLRPHLLGESLDRFIPVLLSIVVMRAVATSQANAIMAQMKTETGNWAVPLGVGFAFTALLSALILIAT